MGSGSIYIGVCVFGTVVTLDGFGTVVGTSGATSSTDNLVVCDVRTFRGFVFGVKSEALLTLADEYFLLNGDPFIVGENIAER